MKYCSSRFQDRLLQNGAVLLASHRQKMSGTEQHKKALKSTDSRISPPVAERGSNFLHMNENAKLQSVPWTRYPYE